MAGAAPRPAATLTLELDRRCPASPGSRGADLIAASVGARELGTTT